MSWRARVADSALVSSQGSDEPRGMNWACGGLGRTMGSRNSDAASRRCLVEARERGDG